MMIDRDDMRILGTIRTTDAAEGWRADGVSIDTRKDTAGRLYFSIKGGRFDGHDFAEQALARGAAGIVIDGSHAPMAQRLKSKGAVFSVDDTVASLGELARVIRNRYRPTVVGITGSNGKTTTREMLAALLEGTYVVGKTAGNLNNLIGLPVSILNMGRDSRVWVLELGTSRYGELAALTRMAAPDVGVLTNIGSAHLEFFESLEGVASAKAELFASMPEGGVAVTNADDPLTVRAAAAYRGTVLTAGFSPGASLRVLSSSATDAGMDFTVAYEGEERRLSMAVSGRHYLQDMAMAILCARHLEVGWERIAAACGRFRPMTGRGRVLSYKNGVTVIDDAYNANPDSMRQGLLSAIDRYGAGRIVAVLGDMLELGGHADREHFELGRFLAQHGVRRFVLMGSRAGRTREGVLSAGYRDVSVKLAKDAGGAVHELAALAGAGTVIYVKGSRSMRLDEVVEAYDSTMRVHDA